MPSRVFFIALQYHNWQFTELIFLIALGNLDYDSFNALDHF